MIIEMEPKIQVMPGFEHLVDSPAAPNRLTFADEIGVESSARFQPDAVKEVAFEYPDEGMGNLKFTVMFSDNRTRATVLVIGSKYFPSLTLLGWEDVADLWQESGSSFRLNPEMADMYDDKTLKSAAQVAQMAIYDAGPYQLPLEILENEDFIASLRSRHIGLFVKEFFDAVSRKFSVDGKKTINIGELIARSWEMAVEKIKRLYPDVTEEELREQVKFELEMRSSSDEVNQAWIQTLFS